MNHIAFFNPLVSSFKDISQNLGTYKWRIEDTNLINKILSSKCGDEFESEIFDICQLQWVIRIYPNGWNKQNHGYCGVFAQILGIPSSLKRIFCQLHIECPEIESKMIESVSYDKPFSFGSYISSFKQLKQYKTKQLTFNITIYITRIILKANNRILYQTPTHKYSRNMRLQWKGDKNTLKKLKSFQKPKGICSRIYNDIWIIKLFPNGGSYTKEGEVEIGLELCCLPSNISKIAIQWTLHCHEANIKQILKREFGADKCYWYWKSNHVSSKKLLKHATLTVSVDITVLKEYDINGKEIMKQMHECKYNEEPVSDLDLTETYTSSKFEVYDASLRSIHHELMQMTQIVSELSTEIQLISKTVKKQDDKIEKLALLAESVYYSEDLKENDENKAMKKEISHLKEQINQILSTNAQKQQKINGHHEKVKEWLKTELNLEMYYAVFIENGFEDLESIKTMNMEILNMMQIDKIGHKMKILRCVSRLGDEGRMEHQEGNTVYK